MDNINTIGSGDRELEKYRIKFSRFTDSNVAAFAAKTSTEFYRSL